MEHTSTGRPPRLGRDRLALALIAAVLGPAALAGEVSRPPAALPAVPAATEAAGMVPIDALASAVAAWVADAMGLALSEPLPRLGFLDANGMAAMRHGGEAAPPVLEVVALYDDRERTILLPQGWAASTPMEVSVLVHEMVHHLQNLSGGTYACPAEREAEAFELQGRWLALHGRSLTEEFELDEKTLFVLTRCGL
jgi:hypothetical protein